MPLSAAQVEARKRGVGGSELLAALGKDSRCTRLELYKRKVGELPEPDFSDNQRVHWGNRLEDAIRLETAERLGSQIIVPQQTLFHPTAPLVGNPDGWMPARNEGVEIKCCDKHEAEEFGEEETDQLPIRYLVQCSGYMALTNADRWHLSVLIGGNDFRMYVVERDAALEAALLAGVTQFWSHVEQRRPPAPETPEDVKLMWPKDSGGTAIATAEIAELCTELARAKADFKDAETREKHYKAEVQKYMQEASQLVDADGTLLATWKTAKPSFPFDDKRFAKEQPALHEKYLKEQPGSRRFLLK